MTEEKDPRVDEATGEIRETAKPEDIPAKGPHDKDKGGDANGEKGESAGKQTTSETSSSESPIHKR